MTATPNKQTNNTQRTTQYMDNLSWDEDFGVPVVELLAYDPITDSVRRVTTDALNHFGTNDTDKASSTIFYEGLEDGSGTWQVVRITTIGDVTENRYATQVNNGTVTNYSDAWTNRATLTYGTYSQAF